MLWKNITGVTHNTMLLKNDVPCTLSANNFDSGSICLRSLLFPCKAFLQLIEIADSMSTIILYSLAQVESSL